jgi:hypothetical protein
MKSLLPFAFILSKALYGWHPENSSSGESYVNSGEARATSWPELLPSSSSVSSYVVNMFFICRIKSKQCFGWEVTSQKKCF